MPATIALAQAGGTVGEWAGGAARGVRRVPRADRRRRVAARRRPRTCIAVRARVQEIARAIGRPDPDPRRQARSRRPLERRRADRGRGPRRRAWRSIYQGIRLTPAEIAAAARDEDVDVVGLSILSGSHLELVPETIRLLAGGRCRRAGRGRRDHPGRRSERLLEQMGVARVYTPKDYRLAGS